MTSQINRTPCLRLQLFQQESSRFVLFLLFVLDHISGQNQTSTFVQTVGVLRSCYIAAANILGNVNSPSVQIPKLQQITHRRCSLATEVSFPWQPARVILQICRERLAA